MKPKLLVINFNGGILKAVREGKPQWQSAAISGPAQLLQQSGFTGILLAAGSEEKLLQTYLEFCAAENTGFSTIITEPGTEWLNPYIYGNYNIPESFYITGNDEDASFMEKCGFRCLRIGSPENNTGNFTGWPEVQQYLLSLPRKASVSRKTSETQIAIALNLDGSGQAQINTGIGFFDHMLHQLARHGEMDLNISVKGDLHIDEHHTIEDTALALGEAFRSALGDKKGIERYGFLLPMDDCLAQIAIDFGGRPWLVWEARFERESIGGLPTEMFMHFFKSFSDAALCNLNIKAEGTNEHHKIESIFKAFAKAIKMAVGKTGKNILPSTKGVL